MPGASAAVVLMAPLLGSSVTPGGQLPEGAMVALPPAPRLAATPFTASFAMTLAMGVAAVPAVAVPLSGCGLM